MLSQPFTPAIQVVWNIFQAIICEVLEKEPQEVVYGQGTVLGKGGLGASFLDTNAPFLIMCDQFKGIDISVFDINPKPDIDHSFEALCYLLRLTDECPGYLKDKPAVSLRYPRPWASPMTTAA